MFDKNYYIDKLKDFTDLKLNVNNIYLENSFYYIYEKDALSILIEKVVKTTIVDIFNSLHPNIKFLINDYIINENNLLNLAKLFNLKLLDLSYYVECSLNLLKEIYLYEYMW